MKNLRLLLLLVLISCNQKNSTDDVLREKFLLSDKVYVDTMTLSDSILNIQIISNGKINYGQKSNLHFAVSGRLNFVTKINGQKVKKGELIAQLDNEILEINIEKAKIDLKKSINRLNKEKINYGSDTISSTTNENLEVISGIPEARNYLEKSNLEYNQTFLKAPFSGIIANIEKEEGDFIMASEKFCTIFNPKFIEVSFSILENDFQNISVGQEVEIQPFVNYEERFKGIISEINPFVDKNGLIDIKANILAKNLEIFDGMNVKVYINKPLKGVQVIPKKALVVRSDREVVFTIKKGFAKWNYVEIVGENSENYAIKKVLNPSDTIIVSGNMNLSHDTNVNAILVSDD